MAKQEETRFGRADVQGYISLLNSIINRMGSNSVNAKNWLMTILAAAIAIQWTQEQLDNVTWLLVPTLLFALTDCYYLGMERHFKKIEMDFIEAVRANDGFEAKLYSIPQSSKCEQVDNTFGSMDSLSIWPFYIIVVAAIIVIWYFH